MSLSVYCPPTHLGRFEVEDRIGRGSVGFVYRVRDPEDGMFYAGKILHPGFMKSMGRDRFLTEARTLQSLKHPNIIDIIDVGDLGHTQYFVMEYAGRGNLKDLTDRVGGLRLYAALTTTAALLRGLGAVHEAGLVHRDVKPSNVLITDSGHTKLVDFGLVRTFDSSVTQAGISIGTFLYSAPEQRYDPRQVMPAADIYSVAATLCTLLTSQPPPNLATQGLSPNMLDPFDVRVRSILERAGAYQPEDRYETAAEMSEAVLAIRDEVKQQS